MSAAGRNIRGIGGEIDIQLLEKMPGQNTSEPDLKVQVAVKMDAFCAEGIDAWLEYPDVRAFIDELEVFNRTLSGKAELVAMSPRDLELKIRHLDSKGHVALFFALGRVKHTNNGQFSHRLEGGFEVEPSHIESLLRWFKSLLTDT